MTMNDVKDGRNEIVSLVFPSPSPDRPASHQGLPSHWTLICSFLLFFVICNYLLSHRNFGFSYQCLSSRHSTSICSFICTHTCRLNCHYNNEKMAKFMFFMFFFFIWTNPNTWELCLTKREPAPFLRDPCRPWTCVKEHSEIQKWE